MKIYLIGFMGSGKSLVGQQLADRLGYSFLDLDDRVISRASGLPIAKIFERFGEARFRELERESLRQTSELERTVIATGGGTPCFFDNMAWINQQGLSCYLELEPAILYQRLRAEAHHRPLLAGRSEEELRLYISKQLDKRLGFYRQAHLSLQADRSPELIIDELESEWVKITGH